MLQWEGSCPTAWAKGREVIGHAQKGNKRKQRVEQAHGDPEHYCV